MGLSRIIAAMKSLVRPETIADAWGDDAVDEPYSKNQMAWALRRERARTDRTGEGFSLLVLSSCSRRGCHDALLHTARILRRRLRVTDEIGWLDHWRLGALLPATSQEGAAKLGEEICATAGRCGYRLQCETYYYPSHPWWGDQPRRKTKQVGAERTAPAQPMEPLFALRLPLWKRCLDVAGAAVGLTLLLPLFAVVAVAVKVSSPGPTFFRQRRSGCGGRPFVMYKFRSMVADAEARKHDVMALNEQDGPAFKIQADPRVTPIGRILRGTSIDELPQLWNVLKGDMSLVGPRPLPCDETAGCDVWHRRRLDVRPGLTCIWQVEGRSQVSFEEWMRMDMRYIRSRSLKCDLKLLLGTIPSIVFGVRSTTASDG